MYKITLRPIFKSLEGTTGGAGFLFIEFRRFLIWDRGPQMFKTFWRQAATSAVEAEAVAVTRGGAEMPNSKPLS